MGLDRTKKLLQFCESPDAFYEIIHIAGTNGKGSTAAMLNACLGQSSFSVGLYTSPHIHSYRERIKLCGQDISEQDFAFYTDKIRTIIENNQQEFTEPPTEFEFLTVLAALYFKEKKVDFAIFETGLGGRLDSTNALQTDISVLTNIGYDHQDILGKTIQEIASEKAAIIRENGQVVIADQQFSEAKDVLITMARKAGAKILFSEDICYEKTGSDGAYQTLTLTGEKIKLKLLLQGDHQIQNMMNVMSVYYLLKDAHQLDPEKFAMGFSTVVWPGRLELFQYKGRSVLLDVAHNTQGALALSGYLEKKYPGKKTFLVGILDDKDKKGLLSSIIGQASSITVSRARGHRSAKWNQIPEFADHAMLSFIEDPAEAFLQSIKKSESSEVLVVFGSFYFVSIIREMILNTK